jgi:hypothetical protein
MRSDLLGAMKRAEPGYWRSLRRTLREVGLVVQSAIGPDSIAKRI